MDNTNQKASTLNQSSTIAAWRLMVPFPQFNGTLFSNTEPVGWSDYNSMQVKVRKRVDAGPTWIKGLTLLSSFTWAKNMVNTAVDNNNNGQCPGCLDIVGPGHDPLTPLIPKPYYLIETKSYGGGTSHGTPHEYDRHVPLLVFGPGVPGGERSEAEPSTERFGGD